MGENERKLERIDERSIYIYIYIEREREREREEGLSTVLVEGGGGPVREEDMDFLRLQLFQHLLLRLLHTNTHKQIKHQ